MLVDAPTRSQLATASVTGHEVNIFQVLPLAAGDVASPCARHLYKLRRGLTHAIIAVWLPTLMQ